MSSTGPLYAESLHRSLSSAKFAVLSAALKRIEAGKSINARQGLVIGQAAREGRLTKRQLVLAGLVNES